MKMPPITKTEQLKIVEFFDTQLSINKNFTEDDVKPFWNKNEAAYIRALVVRDWKMQGKMRKPYQVRNELEHQKILLSKTAHGSFLNQKYWTRIHFASWVLGDSDQF